MNKKNMTKRNIQRIAVIIGVIIIPLMYSYFYLSAFWDPYSKLEGLPIAVVNNDSGALINNEQRNLGNEFVDKLKDDGSFDFIVTNETDATINTAGTKYYAMISIPSNFSSDIASAADKTKQTATITFSANEKRNYLASQILSRAVLQMETGLRENIAAEIVNHLTDQVAEVPGQLGTLNDGLTQLADGSSQLVDGSQTLASGTQTVASGSQTLADGTQTLADGTQTLADGSQTLQSGTAQFASKFSDFNTGLSTLKSGSAQLNTGAQTLAAGTNQLDDGIQAYTAGVDSLIGSVSQTSAFISYFVQEHPELMQDPQFAAFIQKMSSSDNAEQIQELQSAGVQLNGAAESIAQGATGLSAGTSQIDSGIATVSAASGQLNTAADSISSGAATLANGVSTVANGATALADGATTLADGTTTLANGAATLANGQTTLNSGITTAQNGVITSIDTANADASKLNGLGTFVSAPVTVESDVINPIPNYGAYFTPYFMSLSLWVGALIIFFGIYFDADKKFNILSRDSSRKVVRSFLYLLIALTQAVLLEIIIKYALGLEIGHQGLYFISACLVSMTFFAIVQFCIVHMGDLGKLAALLLLILQLTSCGGTFPMETLPKFFNVLYPFMPMTYSVKVFKDSISGVITNEFWNSFIILIIFFVVFFTSTILLSVFKKRKAAKKTIMVKNKLESDQLF
ncbi:hypothetical protein GH810_06705 [Acetobacterium paludosum]|uniref:ABC-2 type transporter transmembrane domain-containing protein n=1 Tax=Acetobacterium paludosum TaxID=52693 RepID=A0A923HXU9_9FIRM|nr:YhgE/Pip domain-containing protein [Acetobacterium paludosum]MBC3887996.1 hypothetical protein [Acetobacterium paludosum]